MQCPGDANQSHLEAKVGVSSPSAVLEHRDSHEFARHPRVPKRDAFGTRFSQLCEPLSLNQRVLGSSPSASTIQVTEVKRKELSSVLSGL